MSQQHYRGGTPANLLPGGPTHEEAVLRAVHLFDCGLEYWKAKDLLTAEGVTRQQMGEGYAIAQKKRDARRLQYSVSGQPEYGR